ncbi:MAG: rhodanese-like domain-containing protein [Chitinophagales bacterium]|jgi:rhodanese-related sulfurtransferase|nr:rhodanese-like domain-containing protein [Chitinophagales bacterium]
MIPQIKPKELKDLRANEDLTIIDVRTPDETAQGVIEGALIGYDYNAGEFHEKAHDLDPDKTYVMVCRSGARSLQASLYLNSMGFEKVFNLENGMIGWSSEIE